MSDFYANEYRALLGAGIANQTQALANTVRNQHAPDCACGSEDALTENIGPEEME